MLFLRGVDEIGGENTEGVLGMRWNTESDTLRFKVNIPAETGKVTKRIVLSTANRIYDPLGLLTPFTVKFKIAMRMIWAGKKYTGWDDEISADVLEYWNPLMKEMGQIAGLSFERSIKPAGSKGRPMLVVFPLWFRRGAGGGIVREMANRRNKPVQGALNRSERQNSSIKNN